MNGFRIELGEIERVLASHEEVHAAAVAVHGSALCAYLVPTPALRKADSEDSRSTAVRERASHVRRHHRGVHGASALHHDRRDPLSANGKVQREKLPSLGADNQGLAMATDPSERVGPASTRRGGTEALYRGASLV